MISPFDVEPEQNVAPHATVLIIGTGTSRKEVLAKALAEVQDELTPSIRLSETVRPSPTPTSTRPRIDYVVFVVDLTNRDSWILVKKMLSEDVHTDYFGGRCCLVLTKGNGTDVSTHNDEIDELALDFDISVLYSELEAGDDIEILCRRLIQLIKIVCGSIPAVNSSVTSSVNLELCHNSTAPS
eukprot:m.71352 g.71352  ORF g.71352 m.71352 type:complete len:184 (-) comp24340_c2_seq1:82-633(-)